MLSNFVSKVVIIELIFVSLKANIALSDISPKSVNLFGPINYSLKTVVLIVVSYVISEPVFKYNFVV